MKKHHLRCIPATFLALSAMLLASTGKHAIAAEPAEAASISKSSSPPRRPEFAVYPPAVRLDGSSDFQSFIAVLRRDDDVTEDATERVNWKIANESIARLVDGKVHPLTDGKTSLVGSYLGTTVSVPVEVHDSAKSPKVSFTNDVMPVLTRASCNTGSCHGAARGKDGFNLSLFGYDPEGDHFRITREIGTRRINLAVPEESLLLRKAVGSVPHTGGKLFETGSDHYKTILAWLKDNVPLDRQTGENAVPTVDRVELYPPQAIIEGDGSQQRMIAVAHYSDGTTRDIEELATFSTNNSTVAAVDQSGLITAGTRGEAFVMARFDTHTVGSQVLTLPENLEYSAPSTEPEPSYVDELVMKKLNQLRIEPSPACSDEEFIRRATIDIAGLLPTEEEFHRFVHDPAEDKRERLVDELLSRKEFSEIWAMKFAQLLMIKSSNQVSYKSALLYANWITDQFAKNRPINEIVQELLTSSGGTFSSPATNFYEIERDVLKTSENVAQVFMGIRTQCAQCHNHPFDRWTMEDYYGFASFFTQVRRKNGEDYREQIIYDTRGGEVNNPVKKKPEPAKYLGGDTVDNKGDHRRVKMAQWLTSGDNPYFATSLANRVWAHFMGVGIVEPVDDIRVSNPASNPELFETLGTKLVEYEFDFRRLVRDICTSDAYARSTQSNPSNAHDSRNYSRALVRRIPAESLLDCICSVTQSPDKFRGMPLGSRAVQIADGKTTNYFLTSFGRSPRATVCECEATTDPSLSQALHLLNGASVNDKIKRGRTLKQWVEQEKMSTPDVIDRIYVRALSRYPTDEERQLLVDQINPEANVVSELEDIYWAVLNSREFVFNH
ncbi:MAG: DUF1549 domain-containing protein [Planctomycetota bacterium]